MTTTTPLGETIAKHLQLITDASGALDTWKVRDLADALGAALAEDPEQDDDLTGFDPVNDIQVWDLPSFGWRCLSTVNLGNGQRVSTWDRDGTTVTIWFADHSTATAAIRDGEPVNLTDLPELISHGVDPTRLTLADWCWRARNHLRQSTLDSPLADLFDAVGKVCESRYGGETSMLPSLRHAVENAARKVLGA